MQPMQMQFFKIQKSHFIPAFLKLILNFEHFFKEDDSHNLCILEVTDCERRG